MVVAFVQGGNFSNQCGRVVTIKNGRQANFRGDRIYVQTNKNLKTKKLK